MAHTTGLVVSTSEEGWAQVLTERKDACAGCAAANNCHSACSSVKIMTKALNKSGAGVGDHVSISLNSGTVLKSAAVLYFVPIAGLMAGAILGAGVNEKLAIDETASSIIFAFAGLCMGFIITALISRWMSATNRLTPIITQTLKARKREFSIY